MSNDIYLIMWCPAFNLLESHENDPKQIHIRHRKRRQYNTECHQRQGDAANETRLLVARYIHVSELLEARWVILVMMMYYYHQSTLLEHLLFQRMSCRSLTLVTEQLLLSASSCRFLGIFVVQYLS